MPEPEFAAEIHAVEDTAVVAIRGELTDVNAGTATTALEQAIGEDPSAILLDLTEMHHIGSSAIPVMIGLISQASAGGRRLRAYGLREHHREIFDLTELSHHIDVFSDERSALDEGLGG